MLEKSRAILVGAVLVIVTVNLFQFRPIDTVADAGYSALSLPTSTNIMEDAIEYPAMARAYGMYLNLAATAPSAEVLVSTSGNYQSPMLQDFFLSFGEAKSVRFAKFDEVANHVLSPEELVAMPDKYHVAAIGTQQVEGQTITRWKIVTGECSPRRASGSAAQFIVLRMNEKQSNYLLLIETCLLPEDTVTE